MKTREQDLMTINQAHQKLVGNIMTHNTLLTEDLKTVSRILTTTNWLDNISEWKLKALKEILRPYEELNT